MLILDVMSISVQRIKGLLLKQRLAFQQSCEIRQNISKILPPSHPFYFLPTPLILPAVAQYPIT